MHKKHSNFLIEDESNQSSNDNCQMCLQYEEDMAILQEKLMETHNKLLAEIDLTRNLQDKLSKAKFQASAVQRTNGNGVLSDIRNKSRCINQGFDEQQIETTLRSRTEKMRKEFEMIKQDMISRIQQLQLENQDLKEQNEDLNSCVWQLEEKIRRGQLSRNKLKQQNEQYQAIISQEKKKKNFNGAKGFGDCSCGFEEKYFDLDKAFMNQRVITNQLIEQNAKLHQLLQGFQQKSQDKGKKNRPFVGEIRTQPPQRKSNKNELSKTRKQDKDELIATKNLIKQLEIAQIEIRNKSKSIPNGSNISDAVDSS